MAKSEFTGSSSRGAYTAHKSFADAARLPDQLVNALDLVKRYEEAFIDRCRQDSAGIPSVIKIKENVPLPPQDARRVAAIEAASLIWAYPQLIVVTPIFGDLYRLLRAGELAGKLRRGGKSIIIGAGEVFGDVAGLYIKPPTEEMVERMLKPEGKDNLRSLFRIAYDDIQSKKPVPTPSYEEGVVLAIEPDVNFLPLIEKYSYLFNFPESLLSIYWKTLGEMLEGDALGEVDTILVHRADPRIFKGEASQFSSKRQRREVAEATLQSTLSHLRNDGTFVLTIGQGNDRRDYEERLALLQETRNSLVKLGFQTLPDFTGVDNNIVPGSIPWGIVGQVIAKKPS